jgi:hypothetical protein
VEIQPGVRWELRMFMEDGRFIRINRDTGEQTETQLKISNRPLPERTGPGVQAYMNTGDNHEM